MKNILLILCITFWATLAMGQDVPFKKSNFPGQRKDLKEARKQMKKGLKLAKKGTKNRQEAIYLLQAAHTFNPDNAALNFRIGELLYEGDNPHTSLPYLQRAYELNPHVDARILFMLARACHLNHQFDQALVFYNGYISSLKPKEAKKRLAGIERYRQQVIMADSLVRDPVQAFVDNLGDRINSTYPEYAPVMAPDGRKLWFTSRRPGSTGGQVDKNNNYFEDIYYLERLGGAWSDPINAGITLNTADHESVVAISADGNTLYIRRGYPTGDIYEVRLGGRKPDKGRKLHKRITKKGDETWITFSPDSTKVWFSSDRKGGYGGYDIWMCEAKRRGGWKKPVNAGPAINTPYNEFSPFMFSDGKTLSFSSNGLPGMGGHDIFYTTISGKEYSLPLNAGFPVNSAADDFHFSIDPGSGIGWLTSNRMGGFGHYDIYRVRLIDEERTVLPLLEQTISTIPVPDIKDVEPIPLLQSESQLILLQGQVTDKQNGKPLEATITVIDQTSGKMLVSKNTGKGHGMYLMTLKPGIVTYLNVFSPGYLPGSSPLDLSKVQPFEEYQVNITLEPIVAGVSFELKRLTYRVNRAEFHTGADLDLDLLVDFMVLNPSLKIMIQGYYLQGEDAESLPGQRAAIIRQFLVREGIAATRILVERPTEEMEGATPPPVYPPNTSGAIRVIVVSND